jgi:hypothetical protein
MKIKDGFIVKKIADKYMVISTSQVSFDKMQTMNETGALLWDVLSEGGDVDSLTAKLLSEYDVDEKTARLDAEEFISKLRDADLLDE